MTAQILPVGPHPTAGVLLLGALFFSRPADAPSVLELVVDSDMPTPSLAIVLGAVRRLVAQGKPPGPQLVADELRRVGTLKHFAARDLQDATTSGAQPLAVREYAAAVVAESFRSKVESFGNALTTMSASASEADVAELVERTASGIRSVAARLAELRGDVDD